MKLIKRISEYYDYIILACIYTVLHIFIHTDYWDDVVLASMLPENNYNLLPVIEDYYYNWTSRIIILAVEAVMGALPNWIWKVCDIMMILLLYYSITQIVSLLVNETGSPVSKQKNRTWKLLLFSAFPYSLFATAGWMTTTIVYTWMLSTCLYSVYVMLLCVNGRRLSWRMYIRFGLALLYASNFEITAVALAGIFLLSFFHFPKSKSGNILFTESFILIGSNLILAFIAPGNRVRIIQDGITHETSDLLSLSFAGKLRMGINSAFYHFMSVPNSILFITCLTVGVLVFYKSKSILHRSVACVPVGIDMIWTLYIFIAYTIKNKTLTYIYPDGNFSVCPKSEQYLAMFSAVLLLVALIYCYVVITDFSDLSWFIVAGLILFGLLPEIALGFTTTVSASIMRTSAFLYFAMIICTMAAVDHCKPFRKKTCNNIFLLLGLTGTILNVLQVIRHIIVYG